MKARHLLIAVLGAGALCLFPGRDLRTQSAAEPNLLEQADWVGPTYEALDRAERARIAGKDAESIALLAEFAALAPYEIAARELVCWRMLPTAENDRERFRASVQRIDARSRWRSVYELVQAKLDDNREQLVALAKKSGALSGMFPQRIFELVRAAYLRNSGLSRSTAVLEVVAQRDYRPLFALRDLDRWMTREAEFLDRAQRAADALAVRGKRDELRRAYARLASNVVEKLFALQLQGQEQFRDDLLEKVRKTPFLLDPQQLVIEISGRGDEDAWKSILQPLLESELRFVYDRPDLEPTPIAVAVDAKIRAERRDDLDGSRSYRGSVLAHLGHIRLDCEALAISDRLAEDATLTATGSVRVLGIPAVLGEAKADACTLEPASGKLQLRGNVQFRMRDRFVKCRMVEIDARGKLAGERTLLDDFREQRTTAGKLAMLPQLTAVYDEKELPAEVRFLLALSLVRPHLTWHAPALPMLQPDELRAEEREKRARYFSRWGPALGGEEWMLADIPDANVQAFVAEIDAARIKFPVEEARKWRSDPRVLFAWRLRDPRHADITRAIRLLEAIDDKDLTAPAQHWAAELRCSNTTITCDMIGSYAPGKNAPVVLDVRNAERVYVQVYRVEQRDDLLWVADRIGDDFIYRDHGLQLDERQRGGHGRDRLKRAIADRARRDSAVPKHAAPRFLQTEPRGEWLVSLAELPILRERDRDFDDLDWRDDDAESSYFNDECSEFWERLRKSYRPHTSPSSWICDRILNVPGKFLDAPGAYVIAITANGQTAYAPLLVDPLTLTLGRCRDGVFALVNDPAGAKPLPGATLMAHGAIKETSADANGAAFLRVFAAGDRAMVAEKDGRFAIGGFGRVFDGIYRGPWERDFGNRGIERKARELEAIREGHLFADQYVLAAYADRPTYRPGQRVQGKLIVRRLVLEGAAPPDPARFRAEEFDMKNRLALPDKAGPFWFHVIDAKGRHIGDGELRLNEFGTAAWELTLDNETPVGSCSFRCRIGDREYRVPDVFSVQYYRRPDFELKLDGAPERFKVGEKVRLAFAGRYYFGKPLAGGRVDLRLLAEGGGRPIWSDEVKLDEAGRGAIEFDMPARTPVQQCRLVATLADETGRSVTVTRPLAVGDAIPTNRAFNDCPGFMLIGEKRTISVRGSTLFVTRYSVDALVGSAAIQVLPNQVHAGKAEVICPLPGWYRLVDGDATHDMFVAPRMEQPFRFHRPEDDVADDERIVGGWVNLSYSAAGDCEGTSYRSLNLPPLLGRFDRLRGRVGEMLRVLVYVPFEKARLLFTLEGATIVDYRTVEIDGTRSHYHVIEIPLTDRLRPYCFVQGRIVGADGKRDLEFGWRLREQLWNRKGDAKELDEDEGPTCNRIDVLPANDERGDDALNVVVTTDRQQYRPGDEVRVRMAVTGADKKPRRAELSLSAIDESVYTFGESRVEDLARLFADPRPSPQYREKSWRHAAGNRWRQLEEAAKSGERLVIERMRAMQKAMDQAQLALERAPVLERLAQRETIEPNVLQPVGQIPLGRLREDFRETAAWLPQVPTQADGTATATFRLPDSLTRYRLTATAITKDSDFGVGHTNLTASLPLAVRVALPRFAMQGDRFLAQATIHNFTERDAQCSFTWKLHGCKPDDPAKHDVQPADGDFIVKDAIAVKAGQSATVGYWVLANQVGTAKIGIRCEAGTEADEEVRTLPVHQIGRAQSVSVEASVDRQHSFKLPEGFTATEANIVIARHRAAIALDGLGYLVNYPYGCVEQTMSRFMPAVVVRDAVSRLPMKLPQDIEAKLPEVLKQGLTRLYRFQHSDGGWGWWEHDQTDPGMTVYVVHGLALCERAGTKVERDVLDRGLAIVANWLIKETLAEPIRSRAWLALTLANGADRRQLDHVARAALTAEKTPFDVAARLCLACRQAGSAELAERLRQRVNAWQPNDGEGLALLLTVELNAVAPLAKCDALATALIARQSGLSWENTITTAAAVQALSRYLAYLVVNETPQEVRVEIGGKTVFEARTPEQRKQLIHRLRLNGEQMLRVEASPVSVFTDGPTPAAFVMQATGVQRLDMAEPMGKAVRVLRRYETPAGKPIDEPVRVGDLVAVRLGIELEQPQDFMLVEDRRPAGLEFAGETIEMRIDGKRSSQEFRDDRMCVFLRSLKAGKHEITYYLRAETPGKYRVFPGCAYPMYQDHVRGETGASGIEVVGR